jgi:hypothetical protein
VHCARLRSAKRWRSLLAATAFGSWAFVPLVAAAQAYPHLHVVALSQRTDRSTVEPGGVFELTIHVKIAQRRDRLDELILGSFENCEIISNETVRTAAPDGTDFVERVKVQALGPSDATISPAYIDAIDPVQGRPMRFSSNAVRVHVTGSPAGADAFDHFAATAQRLLLALAIVAGFFAAAFVVVVLFVRRRRRPAKVAPAPGAGSPPAAPPPVDSPSERLGRAAQAYRSGRSEALLAAVRAALFDLAGVGSGATLVDALRALGGRDAHLRAALLAAESAAFGPASERMSAGDTMLAAIQAYSERRPANQDAWTR